MQLNESQRREIFQNGFAVVRSAVSRLLVDAALRAIHVSLGQNGIDPNQLQTFRSQSYCPEVTATPAITDLYSASPLQSLCESLLGEGNVLPVTAGQIALRFPAPGSRAKSPSAHIDGMYSPHNGVTKGDYATFSALAGVLLSDLPSTEMGNFRVWPGSHRTYERYFQENGVEKFLEGPPDVDLGEPLQITGQAGDAVICHFQLGHSAMVNLSPFIRYGVFFRLKHRDHAEHPSEVLADIWRDWPGMSEVVSSET